jgi:SAM-dependent methyltransferase
MSRRLSLYTEWDLERQAKYVSLCERNPDATVLDLGCGNGLFTRKVADAIGSSSVYGLEIDTLAHDARERGIDVIRADLEHALPCRDEFFDVVLSSQVFEHTIWSDHHLREIFRLLKPLGYCMVSTDNLSSWLDVGALVLGWRPFSMHLGETCIGNPMSPHHGKKLPPRGHVRVFPYRAFREFFGIHGFWLESLLGAGYFPFGGLLSWKLSSLDPRHARFLVAKARKSPSGNMSTLPPSGRTAPGLLLT